MHTSFSPCCATISAGISWSLPPEGLFDAAYVPSIWAVQKTVLMVLLSIIRGPISVASIVAAKPIVHRHLANAPEYDNLTSDTRSAVYFNAYGTRGRFGVLY
jgi:hypothetical protein